MYLILGHTVQLGTKFCIFQPCDHSYSAYLLVNPPMNSSFFSKSQKEFHCFKCLLYGHSEQAASLIRYSHWNISLMARKTTKHSLDGYTSDYSLHTDLHCQPILNWERFKTESVKLLSRVLLCSYVSSTLRPICNETCKALKAYFSSSIQYV